MARLPVPGSDDNTWGGILNDYLNIAHNTDGTLKASAIPAQTLGGDLTGTTDNAQIAAGAVGTTELALGSVATGTVQNSAVTTIKLADGAVTTPKIADGSITAAKLASGALSTGSSNGIRSLVIFYSPPNIINGRYSDDYAAGILARYDDIILGDGLQSPSDTYYSSTVSIIQKIAALAPDAVVWGYIDAGVTSSNHSIATLQSQIDQWVAIGAKGIFCDLISYDYGVSRARQNTIISYIHSKGVGSMLNSFDASQVFGSSIDATYNPSGTPTVADSRDALLMESWICNSDAWSSPYYATFADIKNRADSALAYRSSLGVRLFATNIYGISGHTDTQVRAYNDYTEAFARTFRLDGTGVGVSNYGSSGADIAVVKPFFSAFHDAPFRPNAPYVLNNAWTAFEAPDLGVIVTYDAANAIYTWTQS